jgi:DNA-binding GntR family transcriptional regulator
MATSAKPAGDLFAGRRRPRRLTLTDDVYESVKALIMDHVIAPGAKVTIDVLARSLDVSPTPVREALARLESDGLVTKRPLQGYTTSPLLTQEEFEELFELRLILEPSAAALAAERASPELVELVRTEANRVIPTSGPAMTYEEYKAFSAQDAKFHDAVAIASGNAMLRDSLNRLHAHLHLNRLHYPSAKAGRTFPEHKKVATAIAARRPEAAAEAMREHLVRSRVRHGQIFQEWPDGEAPRRGPEPALAGPEPASVAAEPAAAPSPDPTTQG